MTSTPFFDAPGGIRKEGNSMTLTYKRTGESTAVVCWTPTPPTSSTGCGTPSGNYSGGVLIGSTEPIQQPNKPTNGTCCYVGDPTFDTMAFAGDKIGNASVLWSSNVDTTTSCVTVSGLDPQCTAYYFAFFAIDNTCRYNLDGIYSYSLEIHWPDVKCISGSQVVATNGANLAATVPFTPDTNTVYFIDMTVDGNALKLPIRGSAITTYNSVIDELSSAWSRITSIAQSEYPPGYGQFYTNGTQWFQHDRVRYNPVYPLFGSTDPSIFGIGDLWYDTTSLILKELTSTGWQAATPVYALAQDPTVTTPSQFWYDGTTARQFDGTIWENRELVINNNDPSLPPTIPPNSLWKNQQEFSKWNATRQRWLPITALVYPGDLLNISNGTLAFNTASMSLVMWNGIDWVNQPATIAQDAPRAPAPYQVWVNPIAKTAKKWDAVAAGGWQDIQVVFYYKSLEDFSQGDVWYNPTTSTAKVFDGLSHTWIPATTFFNQAIDPSLSQVYADNAVWFNSSTSVWSFRQGSEWIPTQVVQSPTEPRLITTGFWFNTATQLWYERNGATWTAIAPTVNPSDPSNPTLGTTWFDGTQLLQRTTGTTWTVVPFTTTPYTNSTGAKWQDLAGTVYSWDGSNWSVVHAPYTVSVDASNNIVVTSATCGSSSYVDITSAPLLVDNLRFSLATPSPGNDSNSGIPTYSDMGVGTDGDPAPRRQVIDNLYMRLGAPSINVELTREQMDLAVQKGLDYIRRDSGAGNQRGYFFLDLKAGQQNYLLTSRAVGFNKIVDIIFLYRPRGGFLNSTFGGEIYGQQLIQQLYVSGTFDILSYHLLASYQTVVQKLFASDFQFQFNERTRKLSILRKIARNERILIDAIIEKTEQDLLTDRMTKNWIENWALTEAKIMLGDMRGKFASLPGAGGSVTMNGAELKADAVAMQQVLLKEIDDYNASDIETWGLGSTLTKG